MSSKEGGRGPEHDPSTRSGSRASDPSPVDPSSVEPSPVEPSPVDPSSVDPSSVDPSSVDPSPVEPSSSSSSFARGPSPYDPNATRSASPSTAGSSCVDARVRPRPSRAFATTQLRDPERYLIIGEHGRGGLGRVSRAHDRDLGRDVAIKELISRSSISEVRFLREALITARLEHPGIVPVHEAGRWPDGTPFYAMKLVAGRPLRDLIAERTTVAERIGLLHHVIAVADAIAYAHEKNIIHRDLKPANVIVGDFGETIVIDWGLAKDLSRTEEPAIHGGPFRANSDDGLTVAGSVLGTPAYMAPEQERGEQVDQRADVFAIGAMLWELSSLQKVPPTDQRLRHRLLRHAGIERDLVTIIDKALNPDPKQRYTDAGALAADLKAFKSGARIAARNYSLYALLAHWTRQHRTIAFAVSVAIALIAVGSTIYVRNITAERNRADNALTHIKSTAAALLEANSAKANAYNSLSLKNAELLMATDPSAAWDSLQHYRGTDQHQVRLMRAKAEGMGIASARVSTHKDTVRRMHPLSNGKLLSISEDGSIAITAIDGTSNKLKTNATAKDISAFSAEHELLVYGCHPDGICAANVRLNQYWAIDTSHSEPPDAIALSADGTTVAARHGDEITIQPTSAHSRPTFRFIVLQALRVEFVTSRVLAVTTPNRLQLVNILSKRLITSHSFAPSAIATLDDLLIAGDEQGRVITINTRSNQVSKPVPLCNSRVNVLKTLRYRGLLAYGCQNGDFGVVERMNPNKPTVPSQLGSAILSMATSQDERYIVTGGQGGKMHILDLNLRMATTYIGQLSRLPIVSGPSKNFPYFASGDDDGYIRIWNIPPTTTRTVINGTAPFFDCLILGDGTTVAIGAEMVIRWWNELTSGQAIAHPGGGIAARRADDLAHFVTFGYDGTIILWGSKSGIAALRRWHSGSVIDVEFIRNELSVVSAGEDGRLLQWHHDNNEPSLLAHFEHPISNVEILHTKDMAVAAERDGTIWAVSIRTRRPPIKIRAGNGDIISRSVISPDGLTLGIGTSGGEVTLYSTEDWSSSSPLKVASAIRSLNFSPDMSLASAISDDGHVYLLPLKKMTKDMSSQLWHSIALPIRSSRFSPDGNLLANTTSDGGVYFYSLKKMTWRYFALPTADIFGGRFSADSTRYAAIDSAGRATLFDMTTFTN